MKMARYIMTDEIRQKISNSLKGENAPWFGKKRPTINWGRKYSEETKSKLRKALIERLAKDGHPLLGKKRPEMSERNKRIFTGKKRKPFSEGHRRRIGDAHKGENCTFWKGGITKLYDQIRSCFEYQQWRSIIFRRDDWTCQMCKVRGGNLRADHIKQFALIIQENNIKTLGDALACSELWDLDNGRTLCLECDKTTDTYLNKHYGK